MSSNNNNVAIAPPPQYNLFVVNKPKDLLDGVGGGLTNLGVGLSTGVALCVAAPFYGTYIGSESNGICGGIAGFGIGVGVGVIGCCVLVVGGVYTCLTQVIGGLFNSPEAIGAQCGGKVWDEDDETWKDFGLKEEAEIILNLTEDDIMHYKNRDSKIVSDTG